MNKTQQFHQLIETGKSKEKVLFRPILMQFAAEYIGSNYGLFASDYKVLVEANLRCMDDFDLDLLGLISDPYRETSAFGAKIQYIPNGVPRCLNLLVNSMDDVINLKNPDIFKADTSTQEQAIDQMVYKLYELTYDEAKIVDPQLEQIISREDYEKAGIEELAERKNDNNNP